MIINNPSQKYLSTPIPEEDEIDETSYFLKNESSQSLLELKDKPIFSWKQIKESVNEFLNSNTEIYRNVTSTIQNLEANGEEVMNLDNNCNASISGQNIQVNTQSESNFGEKTNMSSSLSFKNMRSSFGKGRSI
jgi:hypothetical protein